MGKDKKKSKKVKPQILKGFKDYPAEDEFVRRELIAKVQRVFERYGYQPLQTPALEYIETLLGADYGEEGASQIFNFIGPEETAMGLRFDLTAPLARYVASQPHLPMPFRRYQAASVWRTDKPDPGRFREFMQFDIDIVGTTLPASDAEIMIIMIETMKALDIKNFTVRYSNRRILNGLAEYVGLDEDAATGMFRVLDKLDKQGREAVIAELGPGRVDKSGDEIPGLNLKPEQISRIENFLDIPRGDFEETFEKCSELLGRYEIAKRGLDELIEIHKYIQSITIDPGYSVFDITVVRGLGYYTGPIYETILTDLPEYGSVFAGGRYDNLVGRFSGQEAPGTGASIGVDRLLAALQKLDLIEGQKTATDVIVATMDRDRMTDYFKMAYELREQGWNVEVFLGNNRRIPKQLQYADRLDIPVAVICGSNEFENHEVTIKDLARGREVSEDVEDREEWLKAEGIQVTVPRGEMISTIKKMLSAK
jgi:histidyl-tRNA synthetase